MSNLSLSPLKINYKWSNIMQLLLLLVQLKVHRVAVFIESSVGVEYLAERRWCRQTFFFHKIINGLLPI